MPLQVILLDPKEGARAAQYPDQLFARLVAWRADHAPAFIQKSFRSPPCSSTDLATIATMYPPPCSHLEIVLVEEGKRVQAYVGHPDEFLPRPIGSSPARFRARLDAPDHSLREALRDALGPAGIAHMIEMTEREKRSAERELEALRRRSERLSMRGHFFLHLEENHLHLH